MFFNLLKKDLKRKKSMNIILLIFITLCATFMASSIGNMLAVFHAIDYFGEKVNIADYFMFTGDYRTEDLKDWLDKNPNVIDYQRDKGISLTSDNFILKHGEYDTVGGTTLNKIPEKYNLSLDENNNPITIIQNGEIALTRYDANRVGLKLGDVFTIRIGKKEKTFTISHLVKDMIYGSQYMDSNRFLISDGDYDYFAKADGVEYSFLYSILSKDITAFEKDLFNQSFITYYQCDKTTIELTFTMEMVVAAILIVVSVCLIIISLVILRFTIVFTLQDDYREIGVMKGIGLKNAYIKRLYITKYFALTVMGTTTGILFSIPFGNMLIENIKKNIAMESAGNLYINLICGAIIIILVLIFCWFNTGKINKFTAIQAIRNGSTGERFHSGSFFFLHKRGKIPTVLFLAMNSIFKSIKSYGILVLTFIIGTLLVILPLNAVNTLNGENIIELFGISKSDVYIDNLKTKEYIENGTVRYMLEDLEKMKQFYEKNNVSLKLNPVGILMAKTYVKDPVESHSILGFKSFNFDSSVHERLIDGTPPLLANEIAMTERSMQKLGVTIGDSVYVKVDDIAKKYVITASFESMNNMGSSLLFSSKADVNIKYMMTFFIQGDFSNRTDIEGQIAKLKKLTPDYTLKTAKEYSDTYVGDIADTINSMKILLLCVVLFINCLITILLMRTFIAREAGQIALLKNIGFKDKSIRLWQSLRIVLTLFVSITAGALLSNAFNGIMAKYTFGLMGASKVAIIVVPFDVYFLYPMIIFTGTSIAAFISANVVRKISFREINNVE